MRYVRRIVVALVVAACLGLLLRACPSVRDGVPGQLVQAHREGESAARTGVLVLELWRDHRASGALVAVQLDDAGEQVTTALGDVAALAPDTAADTARQQTLMATLAEAAAALDAAGAVVRGVPVSEDVGDELNRVVGEFTDRRGP
ncbi:hypothetical protein H7K45_10205 [Mycobacterium yunnanensis]|uniref:Uncharacterized protein n=1 Tax=Mycobacterium yunnanensis TaxID=368477 RepID=A0A9X2YYL1_9MYCO|nr:hypothetical protein [Mycobacterium yunnanensis]MCV7420910.1 hypothetical protein [Mycobacterium yunnanensis]